MTWRERIAEARERGKFTTEDRALAGEWATCAVGEQAVRAGHETITARVDFAALMARPLMTWDDCDGQRFFEAVMAHAVNEADRLLDAIEDRALQLKREATA